MSRRDVIYTIRFSEMERKFLDKKKSRKLISGNSNTEQKMEE